MDKALVDWMEWLQVKSMPQLKPCSFLGWGLTETNYTSDGLKEVEVGLCSFLVIFCDFPIVGNFEHPSCHPS